MQEGNEAEDPNFSEASDDEEEIDIQYDTEFQIRNWFYLFFGHPDGPVEYNMFKSDKMFHNDLTNCYKNGDNTKSEKKTDKEDTHCDDNKDNGGKHSDKNVDAVEDNEK